MCKKLSNYIEGVETGVYFHQRGVKDRFGTIIIDNIHVEPGIKTVTLFVPECKEVKFELDNVFKQFPDVETLNISRNVFNITMSNFMFPNVKHIKSKSLNFKDNTNILIRHSYYKELLNTFCRQQYESIDIRGVKVIREGAFAGCRTDEIIYDENVDLDSRNIKGLVKILRLSKTNVSEVCGTIFRVGDISDDVELMDDKIQIKRILTDCFKTVKKITIHNIKTLLKSSEFPAVLEIQDNEYTSSKVLARALAQNEVQRVIIDTPYFKFIDDILYTRDGKALVYCSPLKTGELIIPEGVQKIESYAFYNSELETIKMPSTLINIECDAFTRCHKLRHLILNKNLRNIIPYGNDSIISGCDNLIELEIPGSVSCIGSLSLSAFKGNIVLNEGTNVIEAGALPNIVSQKLVIPSTVYSVYNNNFNNIYEFQMQSLPEGFIRSVVIFGDVNIANRKIDSNCLVLTLQIKDKTFYIPKYMAGSIYTVSDKIEKLIHSGKVEELALMYEDIKPTLLKQKTAIILYEKSRIKSIGSYIRRSGNSIIKNLDYEADAELLLKLLRFNLLTPAALELVIKEARKRNNTEIAAYALNVINESDSHKASFKL